MQKISLFCHFISYVIRSCPLKFRGIIQRRISTKSIAWLTGGKISGLIFITGTGIWSIHLRPTSGLLTRIGVASCSTICIIRFKPGRYAPVNAGKSRYLVLHCSWGSRGCYGRSDQILIVIIARKLLILHSIPTMFDIY